MVRARQSILVVLLFLYSTVLSAQTAATITTPAAGSTLPGAAVTFTWSAGTNVTRYYLLVGTTGVDAVNLLSTGQTTARSAAVTGLPTDGRTIYATLYSITAADQWLLVRTTYTAFTPAPPPPPVLITALSRLGWTQPGQTVAQTLAGVTRLYVDGAGAGAVLTVICTVVNSATDCTAPIPALTPGVHTLTVEYTPKGGVATGKSNTISTTTTVTLTPTGLGLRP